MMLFVLNGSEQFGGQVARWLGVVAAPHEERNFEDGEHKARPLASVRGQDVFVLHALHGEPSQSANDKLCRLLFFIGAVRDAGARRVTALLPYLAYARKDRKTKPRDPVTTRYVAALFEAVGTDAVVTLDVHNLAAFENAFRCVTVHLEATALFARYFEPLLAGRDVTVVAPDAGGVGRAERLRVLLGEVLGKPAGAAFAEKHRSGGVVSGSLFAGDVRGKDAIIVDDLVSSGNTLVRTARACRDAGAARVLAVATHGLFTGDAGSVLADAALDAIVVSDSVPPFRLQPGAARSKLVILSSTALFADAVRRIHAGAAP